MPPEEEAPSAPAAPASGGAEARRPRDAALAAGFAEALNRRGTPVEGLTDGRGRDAADRFRVYRNTVVHSLSEALATTFPATRRLMGPDDFKGAAVAYAEAVKPASPVLFRYGETFPDFLMAPGHLPRHVGECARIEYARVQAFHAADRAPLAPDRLTLPPPRLARARFVAHPATRFLATLHGGYGAWHDGVPCSTAAVAVTRPEFDVLVLPLAEPAAEFAARLANGTPLGEAASVEGLDLTAALAALLSAGAFADLS
ncbi:HvfC/BufC family peptide modification chaperone [Acuticoccus sediminis]|uniref:HvfC/BufC family peptide modification chaperone n=1 Tax=Acuticoccus sediminis TaxID=2184697 RepID=UPI001CFCA9DB|nr:DNA-binding domain-containing protein [Acuticoccus sediminis]